MYSLEYTQTADECFRKLRRHEPKAFKKLGKLLLELMEHPETGTGHPEQLKGDREG